MPDDLESLRLQVAELLGWTRLHSYQPGSLSGVGPKVGYRKQCPDWPRSDAAAVELLGECYKRGWRVEYRNWNCDGAFFQIRSGSPTAWDVGGNARRFSEALSRAFVAAAQAAKGE